MNTRIEAFLVGIEKIVNRGYNGDVTIAAINGLATVLSKGGTT